MGSKINVLPESVMRRIAAGEVVERPASVVKELIENSIDAGATSISLYIKGSGIDLICVTDNGEGMSQEDALICCKKHATSKISNYEDLERVTTMGFRGEALSSIAAVSRMEITTRTDDEQEATRIYIEAGRIGEVSKVAANRGTKIVVKDLFGNVPARRKFLKSPATELRHIVSVFRRISIAFPEIDFSLFVEDQKTLDLRKSSLKERLKELITEHNFKRLIHFDSQFSGIRIKGYISRFEHSGKSRTNQMIFLNNRYIVSKSLTHGILSAYGPSAERSIYPQYFIFLEMDPSQFDVNVHPTKIEVRFRDEKYVHDALKRSVQNVLKESVSLPDFRVVKGSRSGSSSLRFTRKSRGNSAQLTLIAQSPGLEVNEKEYLSKEVEKPLLWQIHNKYILSQIKSGLTIIDQHVAHERIIYESVIQSRSRDSIPSQQLLFPQTIQLEQNDYEVLIEILPHLERIGFGLKDFGGNTVVIESIPMDVKAGREREILTEIIESYKNDRSGIEDVWDTVAKTFACKAAVRAGDPLKYHEMASLVDRLFATKEPYFCPHGRPIIINLTLDEIDKRFGR